VTYVSNTFSGCKSLVTLYTPAKVGETVPKLPYTMYDWNDDNAEYTMLPGGNLTLHKVKSSDTGDVNGDNQTDASDISCVSLVVTGAVPTGTFGASEDVNGDNNIDAGDIATLVDIITAGD